MSEVADFKRYVMADSSGIGIQCPKSIYLVSIGATIKSQPA